MNNAMNVENQKGFEKQQKRQVLVITGLSGAGKSTVMRSLEDLGFYCVDNLPVPLLIPFLNFVLQAQVNVLKVAVGIDARGESFLKDFMNWENFLLKQAHFHQHSGKSLWSQFACQKSEGWVSLSLN